MSEYASELSLFEQVVREFIAESKYNIQLSGVAKCMPISQNYFSASFIVNGDGPIPTPSKCNIMDASAPFQRIVPRECTFHEIIAIAFIMADGTLGRRWQIHYSFRPLQE